MKVAFVINPGVQVIDLAGPWETFQDTYLSTGSSQAAFSMFTVSDRTDVIRASGGLAVVPDFTVANAPVPDIVVVSHFDQPDPSDPTATSAVHAWIKQTHARAALTMSICTGAFQLAKTGLLDDIPMTTNRLASDKFVRTFPKIDLRRGPRFVEAGRIATAGGLSAGIDLALRVVSRCFNGEVAQRTADRMEYVGRGWQVWTIPPVAACYWVGEAMGSVDFQDLPKTPQKVLKTAAMVATNAAHVAKLLKERPIPGPAD